MSLRYYILIFVAALSAVVPGVTCAQTDPQFSQYYELPSFYNPAAIGRTDYINIRGAGRLQWMGIEHAPQSFLLSGDMPFKFIGKRFATGLTMYQESIGLFRTMALDARLGYKLRKWGGVFTFGISAGMYDQKFKGSETYLPDDDEYHQGADNGVPTQDLHGTAFDLGAGVFYEHKHWWAGMSAKHLTSPTVTLNSDNGTSSGESGETRYEFQAGRTLYFMAGGNIPVKNTLFEVMPSMLVRSDFTFTTAELTARMRYNKFLSFGAGYRWNDAVYATIAAEFKNFYVGYSYDYPVTAIAKASSGSHEIVVGYRLKLDLGDKNPFRHKAIRLM